MPGEPSEHFLRGLGSYEHLRGPGERNPFSDVRPQRFSLSAVAAPIFCFPLDRSLLARGPGRDEPETLENPASLMGGEVGPVEPRSACDYLLGRKTTSGDDDVMLVHRIRQAVLHATLDRALLELKTVSRDGEMGHTRLVFSDVSFLNCLF